MQALGTILDFPWKCASYPLQGGSVEARCCLLLREASNSPKPSRLFGSDLLVGVVIVWLPS